MNWYLKPCDVASATFRGILLHALSLRDTAIPVIPRRFPSVDFQLYQFAFRGYNESTATWDETKRLSNIQDHGLDFVGCEAVFDGPIIAREDDRLDYGEQRVSLLGWLDNQVIHMTYTERGDEFHVISLRKATRYEAREYFSHVHR